MKNVKDERIIVRFVRNILKVHVRKYSYLQGATVEMKGRIVGKSRRKKNMKFLVGR